MLCDRGYVRPGHETVNIFQASLWVHECKSPVSTIGRIVYAFENFMVTLLLRKRPICECYVIIFHFLHSISRVCGFCKRGWTKGGSWECVWSGLFQFHREAEEKPSLEINTIENDNVLISTNGTVIVAWQRLLNRLLEMISVRYGVCDGEGELGRWYIQLYKTLHTFAVDSREIK